MFVAYATAGFPEPHDTVDVLLALQEGGADIIELGKRQPSWALQTVGFILKNLLLYIIGVPFSDPIADGPTIQAAGHVCFCIWG